MLTLRLGIRSSAQVRHRVADCREHPAVRLPAVPGGHGQSVDG